VRDPTSIPQKSYYISNRKGWSEPIGEVVPISRCQSLGADLVVPISGLVIYPEDSEVGLSGPSYMDAIPTNRILDPPAWRRYFVEIFLFYCQESKTVRSSILSGVRTNVESVQPGNKKTSRWAKPAESPLPLPVGPVPPRCSSRFVGQWVSAWSYPGACLTNEYKSTLRARSICDDEKSLAKGLLSLGAFALA
jgi:hypothetical protein